MTKRRGGFIWPTAATRADSAPYSPAGSASGLDFPGNGDAGGDIRMVWAESIVPRFNHTAIWRYKPRDRVGYSAVAWHSRPGPSWNGGPFEFGTHFYPCDGRTLTDGNALATGGGTGTQHCHEIADGNDIIITPPGGANVPIFTAWDTWLLQARKCVQVGGNYVHTFWPDIENSPSTSIVWTRPTTDYVGTPSMVFYIGASEWTGNGNTNSETPDGVIRHLMIYAGDLTLSEIQTKGTANANDTSDSRRRYCNLNPTPTDVADKSGQGNTPSWANSNRPTLWTP